VVLAVLLLFSIAAPLNQFKAPPIMPVLMNAFAIAVGRAGLLMSVYAVTGLILALPAGLIFQRLGYRVTALLAGGSLVVGAVLGARSDGLGQLLAARVVEGIGTSFMAVMAPAIIAVWFVERRRGTAMGIWSAWVPLGALTMLLLAPSLAQAWSWRAVWWFGAAYAAATTVLFLIFVRPAPRAATDVAVAVEPIPARGAGQVLRSRNIWLLGAAFACFNMAVMSTATFMPTYLNLQRGLPLRQAAVMVSIVNMTSLIALPLGGMLSDRLGSRRRVYLAGFAGLVVILPLMGSVSLAVLPFWICLQGLFGGLIPTNIFSAGVEAAGDARLGGMAMGVIQVGQNAGMLAGPLIFGALVGSPGGWPLAFASLAVMILLGAFAGWLAGPRSIRG
jgi:MFS family permease